MWRITPPANPPYELPIDADGRLVWRQASAVPSSTSQLSVELAQKLAEASAPTTRGRQASQDASDCRGCEACGPTELLAANAGVVSRFKFKGKSLMNCRPENMFDLVRAGDGVKVCSSSRVTGGVSSVGCGKLFDFTSGRVCRPRRRAQCRRAFLARTKSFRFSDGFPRAMVIRMSSLEDRQHPSSACGCVKRDLPKLIFPELNFDSAVVPHREVPPASFVSGNRGLSGHFRQHRLCGPIYAFADRPDIPARKAG